MPDWLETISQLPIYRYGLIFFAVALLIPAIVSGNMVQHLVTLVFKDPASISKHLKYLLGNLVIFFICAAVILYAIYIYAFN